MNQLFIRCYIVHLWFLMCSSHFYQSVLVLSDNNSCQVSSTVTCTAKLLPKFAGRLRSAQCPLYWYRKLSSISSVVFAYFCVVV